MIFLYPFLSSKGAENVMARAGEGDCPDIYIGLCPMRMAYLQGATLQINRFYEDFAILSSEVQYVKEVQL